MINRVVLVGRLTRDPEIRNSGTITVFTVAIDNLGKEKSTSFIPCVVLNAQRAETVAKFAKKGLLVGIEGRLNQRSFVRQDGSKGSTIEVICDNVQFLERRDGPVANEEMEIPSFDDVTPAAEDENKNLDSIEITDDDLPF
jgi:single-strand DNA-binding protein